MQSVFNFFHRTKTVLKNVTAGLMKPADETLNFLMFSGKKYNFMHFDRRNAF